MMPVHNPVVTLENRCYELLVTTIRNTAVHNSTNKRRNNGDARVLASMGELLKKMPVSIVDNLIPKMLRYITTQVTRSERMKGIVTLLRLLMPPVVSKLDLNELFYMQRMPALINIQITDEVIARVTDMSHLTELHMLLKCNDVVLLAAAASCPRLRVVKVSLSQVSDMGVIALARGCSDIAVLELQGCTDVTHRGIVEVLQECHSLRDINADNLLQIIIENFKEVKRKFPFTSLSQQTSITSYRNGGLEWLCQAMTHLETLSLYIHDEDTHLLRYLPASVRTLELEVNEDILGPPWTIIGQQLTTLTFKCYSITSHRLTTIGRCCPALQRLHITTECITDAHTLHNPHGELFAALRSLTLHVYDEEELHAACLEMFLHHCQLLEVVWVNAAMEFLTDRYFSALLKLGTLAHITHLNLSSDVPINLTLPSFYTVLFSLPALQQLAILSWQIDEDEFKECRRYITEHNIMLHLQ